MHAVRPWLIRTLCLPDKWGNWIFQAIQSVLLERCGCEWSKLQNTFRFEKVILCVSRITEWKPQAYKCAHVFLSQSYVKGSGLNGQRDTTATYNGYSANVNNDDVIDLGQDGVGMTAHPHYENILTVTANPMNGTNQHFGIYQINTDESEFSFLLISVCNWPPPHFGMFYTDHIFFAFEQNEYYNFLQG